QKFQSIGSNTTEHWPWHAVSNVIRAHSLIRNFEAVNADRTAITGISWGGYTTCIAASIDHRFKAAVPVYGCGFLYDGESVQRPAIDGLPQKLRQRWIRRYDPSSHLINCTVPILFVNGTNDRHYPLRSSSRSFRTVPTGRNQIRIEVNMPHSHQAGWKPHEICRFVDSHLKDEPALPVFSTPDRSEALVSVQYHSQLALQSASLHFTRDGGPLRNRQWNSVPATVNGNKIHSDALPAD
ncbi:MAG: prolyl oligopeptidase family serine peptidase, partial [Fuerstiella sp.]|nr:prolyl oligopeptidase family serine peptidase [Fuerstiella sp.]